MVDWDKVVNYLQENLPEGVYNAWFRDIELGEVNDDVVYIKFRDRFKLDWVESRYLNLLRDALKSVDGKNYIIRLVAPAEPEELKPPSFNYPEEPVQKEIFQSNLNERYTFENFVVGKSNQFAYSASLGVAKSPGNSYNPLFIYGSVGLGKTHLLHSIGNHIQNFYGNLRILYINTEHFLNEMIQALQNNTMMEFKQKYRSVDVLLIDDIQFLSNKESLQEEFFHTFNELYHKKKQIVITSDRPPKELLALQERIRSRFFWGLIVDIQPPDFETRLAILRKKAEEDGLQIEDDILYYIASNIKNSIRELEGALIKLLYWSSLTKKEITLGYAREVLKDIVTERKRTVSAEEIQREVCNVFNLTIADLKSKSRSKNIVLPRQIAIYLVRKLTDLSLNEIGQSFGNRDHSTIIHAIEKIEKQRKKDKQLKEIIERITSGFEG